MRLINKLIKTEKHRLLRVLVALMVFCMAATQVFATSITYSKYTNADYEQTDAMSQYIISHGIDVSVYQDNIDWAKVKSDGIDYAFIRAGGRGFSAGSMYSDVKFADNMAGAMKNGVLVGVYFFSQAIT